MPEQKPNVPDTLDASWPMSESELSMQVDRRPPDDEPPPPPDDEPPLTLPDAQKKLQAKVQELAKASSKTLSGLTIEIQTLRVVCMLLAEAKEGNTTFDPNTYREMSMLNRMLAKGGGPDDDADAGLEDLKLEEEAAARLAKRGITREGAGRMARVLTSTMARAGAPVSKVTAPPDDDDEGDEPDMAPEVIQ